MNCDNCQEELVNYHLGEASLEQKRLLEEHLMECKACLSDFFEFKRCFEQGDESIRPSPHFKSRLRESVRLEIASPHSFSIPFSRWDRVKASGAAFAMVAASMLMWYRIVTKTPTAAHAFKGGETMGLLQHNSLKSPQLSDSTKTRRQLTILNDALAYSPRAPAQRSLPLSRTYLGHKE